MLKKNTAEVGITYGSKNQFPIGKINTTNNSPLPGLESRKNVNGVQRQPANEVEAIGSILYVRFEEGSKVHTGIKYQKLVATGSAGIVKYMMEMTIKLKLLRTRCRKERHEVFVLYMTE